MDLKNNIKSEIESFTGNTIKSLSSLSGGCINDAYKVSLYDGRVYFLKINYGAPPGMFTKEAHGLRELNKAGAIRVPTALLSGDEFLLTDFIDSGSRGKNFFEDFGRKFAQLHKYTHNSFGYYEDNYIGSTIQVNTASEKERNDWVKFYFNNRILFQYKLAEKNGYAEPELRKYIGLLENKIENILRGSEEQPALLHGDLWAGNFMADAKGEACLIDPAVYYGHREADLAMTKLFGGFTENFYSAYNEFYPLKEGYDYRERIYKLYHVLNHLNLFGWGYYPQAISLIKYYF